MIARVPSLPTIKAPRLITVLCRTCGRFFKVPPQTTLDDVVGGCTCGSRTLTVSPLAPGLLASSRRKLPGAEGGGE